MVNRAVDVTGLRERFTFADSVPEALRDAATIGGSTTPDECV
jgi:hypothetical protein